MNYAGILAGGKGTRMGVTERPKQFLRLGVDATPIIIRTIAAFVANSRIDRIVVACPLAWLEYTKVLIAEHFFGDQFERISVIEGGKERFDSLDNICAYIEKTWGLDDDDILVSHDAVRPFVTQRIIDQNIDAALEGGCVDTVVPATDTIVMSAGGKAIDAIPARKDYYQGQTPQSFRIRAYKQAFDALNEAQRAELTDACKVFIFNDLPVHLVMGEYGNIKITTPHDIAVATAILNASSEKEH